MKTLETHRCILRPITMNDSDDLFEYYSLDIVVKYLPFKKHKYIKDTENFIKTFFLDNYNKNKIGHFAIVYKKNNKVIGNVGFNNISKNSRQGEIGICINPHYWGENLSLELAKELLRYGFYDLQLSKITATTYEENKYSKKTLEVLGFKFVKTYLKRNSSLEHIKCHKYEISKKDFKNFNII
ncbi:MAG: GNAT family N-acetyltransferase [Peptostreptococcaceae bacterium]